MRRSPSLCPDSGQPSELIDYDVHGCMCVVSPLCAELHGNDKWQTSSVSIKECFSIMFSGFSQPRTAFISKQFSDKLSFTGAQHTYMFWGGNWQMSHHSTPQILFFKMCVCVSVRVLSVHFASQYYLIISERLICCLIRIWICEIAFFSLDLSVVIFNCQCACTYGERGGGREMELSFINTWAGKVIVVKLNTFSHRNTEACECQSKQRTAILWETLLHLFLVSLGPRNPWGDPPSPSLQRQVEIHGLSASFCHAD